MGLIDLFRRKNEMNFGLEVEIEKWKNIELNRKTYLPLDAIMPWREYLQQVTELYGFPKGEPHIELINNFREHWEAHGESPDPRKAIGIIESSSDYEARIPPSAKAEGVPIEAHAHTAETYKVG